jgi:hypothetical protein
MLEAATAVRPLAGESCVLLAGARHATAADSVAALSTQCR